MNWLNLEMKLVKREVPLMSEIMSQVDGHHQLVELRFLIQFLLEYVMQVQCVLLAALIQNTRI